MKTMGYEPWAATLPHREIERKFVVRELPTNLLRYPRAEIAQGYMAEDPTGVFVRLRKVGNEYCLTINRRVGEGRDEHNVPLTEAQWRELWPLTVGRRLYKLRFDVPYRQHLIEIDIYSGLNDGLVIAELEFPTTAAARRFRGPKWLGEEVTSNPLYSNRTRAVE